MDLKPKHKYSNTHRGLITLCVNCDSIITDKPSQKIYCHQCKEEKKEELINILSQYNPQYVGQEQFEITIKKAKALKK